MSIIHERFLSLLHHLQNLREGIAHVTATVGMFHEGGSQQQTRPGKRQGGLGQGNVRGELTSAANMIKAPLASQKDPELNELSKPPCFQLESRDQLLERMFGCHMREQEPLLEVVLFDGVQERLHLLCLLPSNELLEELRLGIAQHFLQL